MEKTGTLLSVNVFAIAGGPCTVTDALAGGDEGTLLEFATTVLICTPTAVPLTFNAIVQEAPAAKLPPTNETVDAPGVAVATPPQVFARLLGVLTIRPLGSGSLKFTPTAAGLTAGFVIVMVMSAVLLTAMVVGANVLVAASGNSCETLIVAQVWLAGPPFCELTVTQLFDEEPGGFKSITVT